MLTFRPATAHPFRIAPLLVLGLGLLSWAALAAPTPEGQRSNLIFVTIDTWRGDYLGAVAPDKVATPHLDALAGEAMLFTNTRVSAPVTLVSHASIFTLHRARASRPRGAT